MADTLTVKMSCVYEGVATHPPHSHNEDEAFFIVQGPVNFHVNGEEIILNTNDFIYTPSESSHNIQRVGNDTIKYLVIKRETTGAVPTPYKVGKKDYKILDCCSFPSQDAAWQNEKSAVDRRLLDPDFADGFQIVLHRITGGNKVIGNDKSGTTEQVALYILKGEADVTLNDKQAVLQADNTFYCPRNSSYSLKKRGESPLELLVISTR